MDKPITLTDEYLDALRHQLPQLAFDPRVDTAAGDLPAFTDYLAYYGLDAFTKQPQCFYALGQCQAGHFRTACHYWLPQNTAEPVQGTVIIVHGYFDHVGLFGHLIRYLLDKHYAVVGFDLPGHGLSQGERASIASFDHYVDVLEDVIQQVQDRLPQPLHGIGQSTGGAILLKHLLEAGEPVFDKVTLLAPLVEPALWWFNRGIYLLSHKYRYSVPRKFLPNSSDREFLGFLKADPLQSRELPMAWLGAMNTWIRECRLAPPAIFPVKILQGDKDTTLAWRTNLKLLRRAFPDADIEILPGVRHHMANESQPLRDSIFQKMGF